MVICTNNVKLGLDPLLNLHEVPMLPMKWRKHQMDEKPLNTSIKSIINWVGISACTRAHTLLPLGSTVLRRCKWKAWKKWIFQKQNTIAIILWYFYRHKRMIVGYWRVSMAILVFYRFKMIRYGANNDSKQTCMYCAQFHIDANIWFTCRVLAYRNYYYFRIIQLPFAILMQNGSQCK